MRFSKQVSDTLPRVALLSWMRLQTSTRVNVEMREVEEDVRTLKGEVVELIEGSEGSLRSIESSSWQAQHIGGGHA